MQCAFATSPEESGALMHQPPGMTKRPSKKWTEQEQLLLLSVVNAQGIDKINWAHVAKSLPGRTGKQCREKWKNDLRPDIFKDPWNRREEYILARLHSEVGNQWAEIAKYLPGRSENSIKNHWNATLRSKAEAKGRTLLGLYGRIVVEQQGATSIKAFQAAVAAYQTIPGVEAIETMQVAEEFFQRRPSTSSSPVRVKIGRSRTPAVPQPGGVKAGAAARGGAAQRGGAARKRGRYDLSDSDSLTDEGDGSYCDDGEDDASETHMSRRRRSSAGGSMSRRTSEVASGVPGPGGMHPGGACLGFAYAEMVNGRMQGDATVTVRISGPQHKKGAPVPQPPHPYYMYHAPPPPYHPHGYAMSYGAPPPGMPMAYPMPYETMECGPPMDSSKGMAASEWQGVPGIDLEDDEQDLGWSPLELEMLRGITDFDDVVCSAGSADDMSQPAAASPGSAATMAAPPSGELLGGGQSSSLPSAPLPSVDECGQYGGPDCGQYKRSADGCGHEVAWKEEPEEHGPVGCQPQVPSNMPQHHHTYMVPASHAPPAGWVAKGVPAGHHYMPQPYRHPADAGRRYACEEYPPHPHECSVMVDRQYSNEQYGGEQYHPHHHHAHMHAQMQMHHQHQQHMQMHMHPAAVMVPAAPVHYEEDAYPSKPWSGHVPVPAPHHHQQQHQQQFKAPPAALEAPERARGGSEAGAWMDPPSPSDYCLPGLEEAGSPELRGLDELVAGMI